MRYAIGLRNSLRKLDNKRAVDVKAIISAMTQSKILPQIIRSELTICAITLGRFALNKINRNTKFFLLALVLVFLLSATLGKSFMTETSFEKTANIDSIGSFLQAGKFCTLAGRTVNWESVGGENVTSGHDEEIYKWSIQDVVGDVALVNRTCVVAHIRPQTGENYTDTYDFDYEIATNRTILSAHLKYMRFDTTGFQGASEDLIDEDEGEHAWAWLPTDLYMGATVNISWTWDKNFLGDMLYSVTSEQVIEILGGKQDCWMLQLPPSVTLDGTQKRTETYWVDKDTGIPLKLYSRRWVLDGSGGYDEECVLVNTNIDLGLESTEFPSPTYTLTAPATPGFPEVGKFYAWNIHVDDWFISGEKNITCYEDGLCIWLVVGVTDNVALVSRMVWFEYFRLDNSVRELEDVTIWHFNYTIDIDTREIQSATGSEYEVNMTSLTYKTTNMTPYLAADIAEETYCWFPTNLNVGAKVNITWTGDFPSGIDNATYTVIDEKIVNCLDTSQASWILHMPITSSIDGTYRHTETWYSDKDAGIPLRVISEKRNADGNGAHINTPSLIDTNVYLGPNTYVFQAVADSQTFNIAFVTNSTIPTQTFDFSQGEKKISFNVTGLSGTTGFCNITIPRALVDCTDLNEWVILANGINISDSCCKNRDANHTYIYIPYNHSVQRIVVKATLVVPEFPAAIILLLFFMILFLISVVFMKFKKKKK